MLALNYILGIAYSVILLYASYKDIRIRRVSDRVHFAILVLAVIKTGISAVYGYKIDVLNMAGGALFSALPLLVAAVLTGGKIGGADIKLMAASGLLLGLKGGISALYIGLILSIIGTILLCKYKKTDLTASIPFVPYLSAGCFTAYLLKLTGVM